MKYVVSCLAVCLILVVLVVGGYFLLRQGPYAVKTGLVTEFIMNSEERVNGTFMIWMGADTETAYCLQDEAIFQVAQKYQDQHILVTIKYSTINFGDRDGAFLGAGCDSESGMVVLRVDELRLAASVILTMTATPQ